MPAVARIGDREVVHCSVPKRAEGFATVFANGIQMSGQGHATLFIYYLVTVHHVVVHIVLSSKEVHQVSLQKEYQLEG